MKNRALLIGHYTTVGDIEVLRRVEKWLNELSIPFDVAPYSKTMIKFDANWIDAECIDPEPYTHLIFICGPFRRNYIENNVNVIIDRFNHCVRIGVNLSMTESVKYYNPFDVLLERDSDRLCRPDLSLIEEVKRVPVVGLCLGNTKTHNSANNALRRLVTRANLACIVLDTEWPAARNKGGLDSPEHFESICARLDVMLSSRLHGTVLALKNGIPVIAIDSGAGGSKVSGQGQILGWPEIFLAESVTDEMLDSALERCLLPLAREKAKACTNHARLELQKLEQAFSEAMQGPQSTRQAIKHSAFSIGRKLIKRTIKNRIKSFRRRLLDKIIAAASSK